MLNMQDMYKGAESDIHLCTKYIPMYVHYVSLPELRA